MSEPIPIQPDATIRIRMMPDGIDAAATIATGLRCGWPINMFGLDWRVVGVRNDADDLIVDVVVAPR